MKKALPVLLILLLPAALLAQGAVKVSSIYGPVDWKSVSGKAFAPLTPSVQMVQIGDELRTGPGGTVMLEVPDGSYMVVSENSTLTIQDFWTPSFKNLVNLTIGKVRFYIQRFGGKPNPYRVMTPTALIAVRGTTFEVTVDETQIAEVRCLQGRVAVESAGLSDREVILEEGKKTLVRPGEYPAQPVSLEVALARNRVLRVMKKTGPEATASAGAPSTGLLMRDNDRRNRGAVPFQEPGSTTNIDVQRGKPTLKFPNNR